MFIKQFFSSFLNYFRAFSLLFKNRLWKYIIIPGIISLLIVAVLLIIAFFYAGDISTFLIGSLFKSETSTTFFKIIINIFVVVIIVVTGFLIYRPLALILLAPFLTLLVEKTEILIQESKITDPVSENFIRDLYRSIRINIRYFLFSAFYSLGAVASGLLPVIGTVISTVLLFLVQAYYGGCGLADIILERRGMPVKDRLAFLKRNKMVILGSGSGFLLVLFIPLAGWFIAPGLGTIATTLSLTKIK